MSDWRHPLSATTRKLVRTFPPSSPVGEIAAYVCERAWKSLGVRVWCWPDGTLVVALVGSNGDDVLLGACMRQLFATYARHGIQRGLVGGDGPRLADVMVELAWARAHA